MAATSAASGRARPQQDRAREMRRGLLDSALALLADDPARPPTTQAVADHSHVSIGTVYRYFGDIESMLEELRLEAVRDISAELAMTVGQALAGDVEEAMATVLESLTAGFERHRVILGAFLAGSGGEMDPASLADVEAMLTPLARVLPARFRPDLTPEQLDDLVFVMIGVTASSCLRIALFRPSEADRDAMLATTARMLAAALS